MTVLLAGVSREEGIYIYIYGLGLEAPDVGWLDFIVLMAPTVTLIVRRTICVYKAYVT